MAHIRSLFDSTRALDRPIEKVITYQNRGEAQLRSEISEYVVTDSIEESFEDLLKKMQLALQGGGNNEIGVWVSGFYGSGKSSFTKYLGFGLDRQMKLGSDSFLQLLQNQLKTAGTRALFNQVATTYDPVIIFLDLASEMLAGASMEDISTVLYLKVLQWAGYSEDLKVAELERMLERDDKLEAFRQRAKDELDGIEWNEVHNQPLVANQIASRLATEFYLNLFKSTEDFGNLTLHVSKSEIKRAEEMVDLVRRKSGKKNIIFIIDEVGQYVSAKQNLILNLDGLAKNLKQIGGGAVWLFGTAQQTLTEDNPSAILNAPGLFKLKDRFPIQVHLEASDIKEICHRRLLTKSSAGEKELGNLFESNGASLRTATQLQDGGVYESPLDKRTFINLYPFLPAHFEILLQLLGRLARKTGGLGLRSAIKVLQDVLVERGGRQASEAVLADCEVGVLANTVTFYDSLRRDILSSYPYIVEGIERVEQRFPNQKLHLDIAKSIAVLQILENLPVTAHNIAALLQPAVKAASIKPKVEAAIETILKDGMIPLGEKNGSLRFLTRAAITLQKQFDQIEYRQADVRAEINGAVRGIFHPLPSARLQNVRPVTGGLKVVLGGGQAHSLEGEKEPIQFHVEFVPTNTYDNMRSERENDSRSSKDRSSIYIVGRTDLDAEQLAVTMVRCRKFLDQHRTTSDPETQEFVRIVGERLERVSRELEVKLNDSLLAGSFVFQGSHKPVSECGTDLLEASKAFLSDAAAKVFEKYVQAAHQADFGLAEKFLKTPMDRITSAEDPLGLISRSRGRAHIKTDSLAIVSIKDFLGQQGQVEGRRILDHFNGPPFGWSKDTTRYILAAAFLGTEITLRISGEDHNVPSDESLKALASNKAFGPIGVSLRDDRPAPEALANASQRLTDLTGDNVLPQENNIAESAKKHFPVFQQAFGPLATELRSLDLPTDDHAERAENLANDLTEIVSGDGSDAVKRLGGAESPLYDSLLWARKLKKAFDNGLRVTLSHLRRLKLDITALPDSGAPAELKKGAADPLRSADEILHREAFFEESSALGRVCKDLDTLVAGTVENLARQQEQLIEVVSKRWQDSPPWKELNDDDRVWFIEELGKLPVERVVTLEGLRILLSHDFTLNYRLRELGDLLFARAAESRGERREAERAKEREQEGGEETSVEEQHLFLPGSFRSSSDIEALITQLNGFLEMIQAGKSIHVTCRIIDEGRERIAHTYP